MLAIASRTVGPKLFEGTLEYPEGNIPCKPQVTLFRLKVDFYHAELED